MGSLPPTVTSCSRCRTPLEPGRAVCATCGALLRQPAFQLATAGRRLGQYMLDVLLLLVTLLIGYWIWSLIIWGRGQTPGMQILHMRVIKADNFKEAGRGTMAFRQLIGKLLLFTVINLVFVPAGLVLCFMLLWDRERQEVWDKIANTLVINDPVPPGAL